MSTRIAHNILSMTAQRAIYRTQLDMDRAVNRLSTGFRINKAWDDPAGLAVSERFRAQITSMIEAERNANYNVNVLATAEGSLSSIDEILIRMRALALQASNGALIDSDREALDLEFQQLKSEITRIANSTNYAGTNLLDGSFSVSNPNGIKFHIGTYNVSNEDYYYVNFNEMTTSALGINMDNILNTASAQASIVSIDEAIQSKDTERARLGSYVNRLQYTIKNLQVGQENASSAEDMIRGADIAKEMSDFTRAQIMMQTGVSMLSQANMVPQIIAQLIG
ncbi:flagellin [bacterium]|nr:flagellin [bacterium]